MENSKGFPWISLLVAEDGADIALSILMETGALGIETRDGTTMIKAPSGFVQMTAFYENEDIREKAVMQTGLQVEAELRSGNLIDESWRDSWKEYFRPVKAGRSLLVCCPWHEIEAGNRLTAVIDPRDAFGTGGHASTILVLEALDEIYTGNGLPKNILDVGCGSGILSICALLLGAEHCTGIDIDEDAVKAAVDNAVLNSVQDRFEALCCTAKSVSGEFPLVLANLEYRIFIHNAALITKKVKPGGKLILSGMLEGFDRDAVRLFPGFVCLKTEKKEGWVSMILEKDRSQ